MARSRHHSKASPFRHKTIRFLALLLLVNIAACDQDTSVRPIRISANSWIGYEPLFIAETEGFFQPGTVHLIETPFSVTLEQSLRGGTIDASAQSLSRAFSLVSEGLDITIVLVLDWSNGADKLLARPGISDVNALKGKRIGSEPKTVNTYLLLRALQKHGLTREDVTIVPIMTELLNDAYEKNQIDAASLFGPEASALEEAGAKTLFDSSEIPGEILDVLVVRTPYLETHPEQVANLIDGWLKAVTFLSTIGENETVRTGLVSPEEFKNNLDGIRFAGRDENMSFMEAGATRLNAVLNARRNYRKTMGDDLQMEQAPKVDASAFFLAIDKARE